MREKKIAIWGAGRNGGRFGRSIGEDNYDFFIDNDRKKSGIIYLGKNVISPENIQEEIWKKLFVYIPFNYSEEVKGYLKNKGLKEDDYEVYGDEIFIQEKKARKEINEYVSTLRKCEWENKELVWGSYWNKYGYKGFYDKYQSKGNQIALLSEVVWVDSDETSAQMKCTCVVAPTIGDLKVLVKSEYKDAERAASKINEEIVPLLEAIFPNNKEEDYYVTSNLMYRYVSESIGILNCKRIICHGSVEPHHHIIRNICRENGIEAVYTHPGCLPGTLSFDYGGEVGESLPALYPALFRELNVTETELTHADRVWEYLFASRLNRKVQPKSDIKTYLSDRIKNKNRPIVLYTGQNDVLSYMVPYTENTRKYHSPIFHTSVEAAIYLAELCERNKWNFVYKPHPMYIQEGQEKLLPDNAIFLRFGDINDLIDYCDVTVTILSSANYVALIRKKPVVMLGYNHIKDKGCCYEAYEKEKIDDAIKEALEKGFTREQQENFRKHIAQLLKYYLYDDLQPREIRYGKPVPDSFEGFYELKRLLESEN